MTGKHCHIVSAGSMQSEGQALNISRPGRVSIYKVSVNDFNTTEIERTKKEESDDVIRQL